MTAVDRPRRGEVYSPEVPIEVSPLFDWPPNPIALIRYVIAPTVFPFGGFLIAMGVLLWYGFTPDRDSMTTLEPGWIGLLWLRNAVVLCIVVGLLHAALYIRRTQDQRYKYLARWPATTNRSFLWSNQVRDNMFWSIASGVTIWTAWEAVTLWLMASGRAPTVSWNDRAVYLTLLTLFVFFWGTFHFYVVHRALHWAPLYRLAHALHHKNTNTNPWSGIAMHPLEHLLYFSVFALFWFVPAHGAVIATTAMFFGVSPAISHSGFDRVEVAGTAGFGAGDYFHHLHHRYFECNYGNRLVPMDKLFGTFHDGSAEAHARMKRRRVNSGR